MITSTAAVAPKNRLRPSMLRTNPRMLWQSPRTLPRHRRQAARAPVLAVQPLISSRGAGCDARLSELRAILARRFPPLHERALVLDHLLEPAAFLGDVFVFPGLGRLGDAVDIALIDPNELDALAFELLD